MNQVAKALVERILRAAEEGTKFRVIVVIPEVRTGGLPFLRQSA